MLGLRLWRWRRRLLRFGRERRGKQTGRVSQKKILLGYYIRLRPGSQESRVYLKIKRLRHGKQINRNFGIKLFLSQNWGACVYTKIWEEERENSKLPRLCQLRNRLHKDRYQLIRMRHWDRLSSNDVRR